jgi:anti-sigma B factor antagonist
MFDVGVGAGVMNEWVPFEVRLVPRGQRWKTGRAIVALTGAIDMMTAPEVERVFAEAMNDGYVDLVADMAGVEFIDVVGLGTLAGVAGDVRDVGGNLMLRSPNELTRRICRLIELDAILPVEEEAEDRASVSGSDRARRPANVH